MKKELTPWQRTALAHLHDVDITDEPHPACMHLPAKDRSVILTCDIDIETAQTFGGSAWHVSVGRRAGRAPQPFFPAWARGRFSTSQQYIPKFCICAGDDNRRNEAAGRYRTVVSAQQILEGRRSDAAAFTAHSGINPWLINPRLLRIAGDPDQRRAGCLCAKKIFRFMEKAG